MENELFALRDKIVVVSKNHSLKEMKPLYDQGFHVFGENRVQELVSKQVNDMPAAQWHMIGHLQRNKVKYAVKYCQMIQSVDSLALLQDIDAASGKDGRTMDVLLQVNIAREATKFGLETAQVEPVIRQAACLNNVNIRGLMVIGPHVDDPDSIRQVFAEGRQLFDRLKAIRQSNLHFDTLSMGMSQDYKIALECGSTMLRLGHIMFGLSGGTMR